jgi:hypothetical protein
VTWPVSALYTSLVARVAAEGPLDCDVVFGWRAPARSRLKRRRIAVIPGDESGSVGEIAPGGPSSGDGVYRALATLRELVTIECEANDPSAPEDELAQYRAARALYDVAVRGAMLAMPGRVRVSSTEWETRRTERRHGALLRVVLELDAVIPDAPPDLEAGGIVVAPAETGPLRAEGVVHLGEEGEEIASESISTDEEV